LDAIKYAKENGIYVHTYTTFTKHNINSIDYIMKLSKEIGFYTEFGFPVARGLETDAAYKSLDLSQEEFRQALKKLIDYKKKGYPILFSDKVFKTMLNWHNYDKKYLYTPPQFKYIKCFGGKYMCFIDCDGRVYPCIQHIGTFDAQSFLDVGFKKAWERLGEHKCKACYLLCVNDFNLLFNFDLSAIRNNIKISLREL
jgi:MoaA/NifB/PqqE/SkfB family radical SAM enzyme